MSEFSSNGAPVVHELANLDISQLQPGDSITGIKKFKDYKTLLEITWDQDRSFDELIGNVGRRIETLESVVRGTFHGRLTFSDTTLLKRGLITDTNTQETMRGYLYETAVEFHPTGRRRIETHFGVVMGMRSEKAVLQIRPYDLHQKQFDIIANPELDTYHRKAKAMGQSAVSMTRSGGKNRRPIE
jgi:hypothetical protein